MFCVIKTVLLRPRNEYYRINDASRKKDNAPRALYPFAIDFEGVEKGGGGGKHRGRLINSIRKKNSPFSPRVLSPAFLAILCLLR